MVFATRSLVESLLDAARRREPDGVTIALGVTPARDLEEPEPAVDPEAQVFTHSYLPAAGASIESVFGIDLGTPPGRTPGIFVSHPAGNLAVDRTDELREVVFVAVPPWDESAIAAFDRKGRERPLTLVDATPPDEPLP